PSLCLPFAWTCMPVRPGENLPCPSLPLAEPIYKYVTTGLKMRTSADGVPEYYCEGNDALISVDQTTPTELPTTSYITCKPNSGIFVDEKGMAVGPKRFNCGWKCGTKCADDLVKVDSLGGDFYQGTLSDKHSTVNGCDVRTFIYTPTAPATTFDVDVITLDPYVENLTNNGGGGKSVTTVMTCNEFEDAWIWKGKEATYIDDRHFKE
ncbi:hypothetical protein PENTCL1PPCAC_5037, partial [Pristionchus entomophagus]